MVITTASTAEMTDDAWQAHVTREAAREIGGWLAARGRLERPISSLGMRDLEAMADNAICRFIVLASQRIAEQPEHSADLSRLLLSS
jgi:hypothetical protein